MGRAQNRRRRFLQEHPLCCFCGGSTPSEEEDHVPGRTFFSNRQWPEGYVFPACSACNDVTRFEEKVLSLVSRFTIDDADDVAQLEFAALARDVAKHDPEVARAFKVLTHNQVRRFMLERGIERPPGLAYGEFPILKFDSKLDVWVRKYSRKVVLALWYMHVGKILPGTGAMRIQWMTNADRIPSEEKLEILRSALLQAPSLERSKQLLNDQFKYTFDVSEDRTLAIFFIWFRASFGILAAVALDGTRLAGSDVEYPFS